MKRDSVRVIGEYLALVKKGDQAALIDLVARHPEELGSLGLLTGRSTRQELSTDRHKAILQAAVLFAMVFVALVFITANLLPAYLAQGGSPAATLALADGEVYVLAADAPGDATWQPAKAGASIQVGDCVRTGSHSIAQLTFTDGSMTGLEAETEIAVAGVYSRQDGGTETIILQQRSGRTYNRIQPSRDPAHQFEIETPVAVTAARGTEFVVDVESSGATHVVVIEGVVDVTAQEVTVEVQASQETTVEPAQSPTAARPASMPLSSFQFASEPSAETETPDTLAQTETPRPTSTPQPGELQSTKTPHPTHTPKLTNTPKPTHTPQPTNTPKPTHTPKPTKEPQPTKEAKPTRGPKP